MSLCFCGLHDAVQAWSREAFFGNYQGRVSAAEKQLRAALKSAGGDPDARSGVVRDGVRRPA